MVNAVSTGWHDTAQIGEIVEGRDRKGQMLFRGRILGVRVVVLRRKNGTWGVFVQQARQGQAKLATRVVDRIRRLAGRGDELP